MSKRELGTDNKDKYSIILSDWTLINGRTSSYSYFCLLLSMRNRVDIIWDIILFDYLNIKIRKKLKGELVQSAKENW